MTTYAGRPVFPPFFTDSTGNPQELVSITIYNRGTTVKPTLYTSRTKATTLANPFLADSLGNAEFYLDPGEYDALVNGVTLKFSVVPDPVEPIIGAAVGGRWIDARRHGAVYDGFAGTDNTAAIQAALNAARQGDTVWIDPTALGARIEGQITVPRGVKLLGNVSPGTHGRLIQPNVLAGSVPENSTLCIVDSVVSPIVLLGDATIEGFNFFYPYQNWDITSLAESFVTYPPTIQLGNAANPNIHSPVVRSCNFLGASHGIAQYATDGSPIQCPTIEDIGGFMLGGSFLRLNKTNDLTYVRRLHMGPNDLVYYALAKGADGDVFTAIAAKTTTVFHLGAVDDIRVDGFYFGCRTGVYFDNGMFTGDTAEGFGGQFDLSIDGCYRAFHIKRGSNAFPLVINGWYTPIVRPNGAATDSDEQCFMHLDGASAANLRIHIPSLRVFGAANDAFPTDYSGPADHAFTVSSPGANNNVLVSNASFAGLNVGVLGASAASHVYLGQHTVNDAAPKYGPVKTDGKVLAAGGLGTGASDPASAFSGANITRAQIIYDASGNVLGYSPIYSTFTP